jgi:hypothetical protein
MDHDPTRLIGLTLSSYADIAGCLVQSFLGRRFGNILGLCTNCVLHSDTDWRLIGYYYRLYHNPMSFHV